jgi:hypothetical protein
VTAASGQYRAGEAEQPPVMPAVYSRSMNDHAQWLVGTSPKVALPGGVAVAVAVCVAVAVTTGVVVGVNVGVAVGRAEKFTATFAVPPACLTLRYKRVPALW